MKMKRFKMMVVAVVAVSAMLLSTGNTFAQTMSDGVWAEVFELPTGTFVSQAEAEALLTDRIVTLKGVLETLTPGTQAYKSAELSLEYYDVINVEITNGKDVPNSIVHGLGMVAQDVIDAPNQTQLMGLRTESISLLSQ